MSKRKGVYFSYDAILALTALVIGLMAVAQLTIATADTGIDQEQIEIKNMKMTADDVLSIAKQQDMLQQTHQEIIEDEDPDELAINDLSAHIPERYDYEIRIETTEGTETIVEAEGEDYETVTTNTALLPTITTENQLYLNKKIKLILYK